MKPLYIALGALLCSSSLIFSAKHWRTDAKVTTSHIEYRLDALANPTGVIAYARTGFDSLSNKTPFDMIFVDTSTTGVHARRFSYGAVGYIVWHNGRYYSSMFWSKDQAQKFLEDCIDSY